MSAPVRRPSQKLRKLFPGWRLKNGLINASEPELEASAESCERWAAWGAAFVILGVVAEVAIAAIHPPYDSFLEQWGTSLASAMVAIGVGAEVLFGRMGSRRQSELTKRSNDRLGEIEMANGFLEESAAMASERAAKAELKIEELRAKVAPRSLDKEALLNGIKGIPTPTSTVRVVALKGDNEAQNLAWQIAFALGEGKGPDWPMAVVYTDDAMSAGGSPEGITVTEHIHNLDDSVVGRALVNGLTAAVGHVSFSVDGGSLPGTLRIIVAQKPL